MERPESGIRTYFWAYDIFGYLLPGLLMLFALTYPNQRGRMLLDEVWSNAGRLQSAVLILFACYAAGHLVAAISSWFLERQILRNAIRYPTEHLFASTEGGNWLTRILLPGYFRSYSSEFKGRFNLKFEEIFRISTPDVHDRFWLAWSYVSLHHPAAYRRSTHFLELYGFARNMSLALTAAALAPIEPGWASPIPVVLWISACLLSGALMFANYAKLLRRLNDEVCRGFVACTALKPT